MDIISYLLNSPRLADYSFLAISFLTTYLYDAIQVGVRHKSIISIKIYSIEYV